ncbi:MAG: ATP-binding cassette domain-containing protein [bacterium]|nr:ATP-binding cassette domain-containing protein [bacterium]
MKIEKLTILPGHGKHGIREEFEQLELRSGDIISIVGPTGSGKSQLLYDIEVLARGDTVSGRKVLLNGRLVPREEVMRPEFRLTGHVGQNLKFYLDLSVEEFLHLHAELFGTAVDVEKVLETANMLTGEPILPSMNLQELSGGQARALMIADILLIRDSPILLADEIENAGINKLAAMELFTQKKDRIVVFVTHDPVLALSSKLRIVMEAGAIKKIIITSEKERELLEEIKKDEKKLLELREKIRKGEVLA